MRVFPVVFLGLVLCALISARADDDPFADGNTVLFLGDSITQNGRYVAFVETYLWATHPDREVEIVNLGVSGETASGDNETLKRRPWIHGRLDAVLEAVTPDVTFVCYGMNDGIYHPPSPERFAHFRWGIDGIVKALEAKGSKVYLITPPPFDAATKKPEILREEGAEKYGYREPYGKYDEVLADYGDWILERGKELAGGIDLGTPLRAYIAAQREADPEFKFGDGVHPPPSGHLEMALALLDRLGIDREKAAATIEQVTGETTDPAPEEPTAVYQKIIRRHAALSGAYRGYVGRDTKSPKGKPEKLAQAIASAGAAEEEIRREIAERMKAEVPATTP